MCRIKNLEENEYNELKSLLTEIKNKLVEDGNKSQFTEKWLDNQDVCITLKISKRTLQNYRDTGVLPFSRFGGKIYYKASDIEGHLTKHYKNIG